VSWQDTDGFRDHSGVEQKSVFFGAARQDDRSFWKIFGFAGSERTQLAFLASEKDVLEGNLRDNPLSPDERDSFGQRFVQGQYHHALGASAELSVQGYYNGAGGWYRLRNEAAMPSGLFEYGLHWRMIGASTTLQGQWGRASVTWGFHANDFRSHHTRDVVDSARDYANRGFKNEVSSFGRVGYDADRWHHYADAQVRWARFRYEGDVDLEGVSWTFFNPKLGTRYDLARGLSVYASVGRAMREPTRMDMLSGEDNATMPHDLTAVEPERVVDVETGIDLVRPGFSLQASVYAMEFRDEIALTGELSEIGLPLRRNVDRSYRRGIEVDARWQPRPEVRVHHTANLGRSRIREWTQFFDVYDAGGGYLTSEPRTFEDVAPLLTAAYVGNLAVEWDAAPWLTVGGAGRYVSEAYLDNTSNEAFTTPGWFTLDASAAVKLGGFVKTGAPVLRIFVDNVLNDDRLFPSGYSYLYLERDAGGRDIPRGIAYYYPLATRSVFVTLDLSLR
jgi:iron complex outermembrane receptor protein